MLEAESILVTQGNVCPDCHAEYPLRYNFCITCGLPLPALCYRPEKETSFSEADILRTERQAEIEGPADYRSGEPVATYRGHVGNASRSLTSLLKNGEMPESLTINQAAMTNQGQRPSTVNIINGRVPTAYCLDQVRDHFGARFETTDGFCEAIEQVAQAKKRLAELRMQL